MGEKFPLPPMVLVPNSVHAETGQQKLEEVLLEHEQPMREFLEEVAALAEAAPPPRIDEELDRQALEAGRADGDSSTPE